MRGSLAKSTLPQSNRLARLPGAWKRKDYKLAVIGVEYPDQKHSESVKDKDWEESLFSSGKYTEKSATGQKVYGSMADYYKEISCGTLKVEGKFAGWVEVSKKRTFIDDGESPDELEEERQEQEFLNGNDEPSVEAKPKPMSPHHKMH